jgi:hypothetical protein
MTIDKIRANMQTNLFEHWVNCRDIEILNRAKKALKSEIANGLLKGIQYQAELQLLQLLTEQE